MNVRTRSAYGDTVDVQACTDTLTIFTCALPFASSDDAGIAEVVNDAGAIADRLVARAARADYYDRLNGG